MSFSPGASPPHASRTSCAGAGTLSALRTIVSDAPSHHPPHRHTIEAHLGIKAGETSADGLFTLTEVECLGACVNAPMIQVNDMFFEDLTPENTVKLLDDLINDREVVVGPQNGRINSLGPMGRTSLTEPPPAPYCRELPAPFVPPS